MNKLDFSFVAPGVTMPLKSGMASHWQDGMIDALGDMIIAQIGDSYSTGTFYRLWGAVLTIDGSDNATWTEGAFFYNGEVYHVPAQATLIPMGDGVDIVTEVTYAMGVDKDPVTFSDSSTHNVCRIKTAKYLNNSVPTFGYPLECRFNTKFTDSLSGTSLTVYNTCNNYYAFSATASGDINIILDSTNRTEGSKVVIYFAAYVGDNTLTFSGTGSIYIAGPTTIPYGSERAIITIEYAGNDATFCTIVYSA